jgi:hypothetical protein
MLNFYEQAGLSHFYDVFEQHGLIAVLSEMADQTRISWFFLMLAVLAPLLIILSRNEARVRRLKNLQDFIEAYPSSDISVPNKPLVRPTTQGRSSPALAHGDPRPETGAAGPEAMVQSKSVHRVDKQDPSLEFVKSKYMADAYVPAKHQDEFNAAGSRAKIQMLIRYSRVIGNPGDMKLIISSLGFIIACYFGFATLYWAFATGLRSGTSDTALACTDNINLSQLSIIAALAFAGSYITSIRVFLRGLSMFDLSAYTFLRQTIEMFASVSLIVFAFKAAPQPFQSIENMLSDSTNQIHCSEIPWYWYALAPTLSILPESSTNFLFTRVQRILTWIKRDDDRFAAANRIIPLDVIEGIDYFIRFRLEECGIHDVQNLATFNPILLSVESPYSIYQCVDWIGQAQLCHIIGLDRFLLLREMHVRTIFDLERAIDFADRTDDDKEPANSESDAETSGAERRSKRRDSPDEFDTIYAGILFAATQTMRDVAKIGGVAPLVEKDNGFVAGTVDEYCVWARQYIARDKDLTKRCIEHLMAWISDDLHVRRLRRIWQEMTDNLGERSAKLGNPPPK